METNFKTGEKKKKKNWSVIIQSVIGFFLGAAITFFAILKIESGQWPLKRLPLLIIFLFISIFININIHEFGHYIFGKYLGYKLLSYRISMFTWNYENGRMKFSIIKNKGYSGLCAMIPPNKELPDSKNALYYSGGIMFNIITGIIFISAALLFADISQDTVLFLNVTGYTAIFLGLTNFIPFVSVNMPTDGKIIWSLILKRPFAKKLMVLNKMTAHLSAGIRPRDLEIIEKAYMDNPDSYDYALIIYSYLKALDNGDCDSMFKYADLLQNNLDSFPAISLPGIYYEICYTACIKGDEEKAREYYKKAGKILQSDKDINGLRVKAYYEYYINKDMEATKNLCESALAVADKFPLKGQGLMESDLVLKLKELILSSPYD
jgi:tetratricopeptide (TPR) repeat protein